MQVNTLQTLGDPSRLQIIECLRGGERPVGELVDAVGIHQSGVSRHLRILLEAGFVEVRPEGQRRLYSLRPEPFQELEGWASSFRRLWEARLDRFGDALGAMQRARAEAAGAERGSGEGEPQEMSESTTVHDHPEGER